MKNYCPVCSGILLRHLCPSKISWFCLRCRQEMPNLNSVKFNAVREKLTRFYCGQNNKNISFESAIQNNTVNVEHRSTTLALFLECELKRLEVISFILSKIDIIMVNTLIDSKNKLNPSKTDRIHKKWLVKANFLRDSEIILLHICQAILVADRAVLENFTSRGLNANSVNFKFPIEQSLFINLIKTLAIDFVYSITLNSERSIDCFALEVGSYFEIVIDYLNAEGMELQLKSHSVTTSK